MTTHIPQSKCYTGRASPRPGRRPCRCTVLSSAGVSSYPLPHAVLHSPAAQLGLPRQRPHPTWPATSSRTASAQTRSPGSTTSQGRVHMPARPRGRLAHRRGDHPPVARLQNRCPALLTARPPEGPRPEPSRRRGPSFFRGALRNEQRQLHFVAAKPVWDPSATPAALGLHRRRDGGIPRAGTAHRLRGWMGRPDGGAPPPPVDTTAPPHLRTFRHPAFRGPHGRGVGHGSSPHAG